MNRNGPVGGGPLETGFETILGLFWVALGASLGGLLLGGSWKCLDVFNKEDSIRILVRF